MQKIIRKIGIFLTLAIIFFSVFNLNFKIQAGQITNSAPQSLDEKQYLTNYIVVKYKNKQAAKVAQVNVLKKIYGAKAATKILNDKNKKFQVLTADALSNSSKNLLSKLGTYSVIYVGDKNIQKAINDIKNIPGVISVQPRYLAKINAASDWTDYSYNGIAGSYPLDFENPESPLTGRHWYLQKSYLPQVWKKFGCNTDSALCTNTSNIIIAVIDTGVSVQGTTDSPQVSTFTYTNDCVDSNGDGQYQTDECLIPIAQDGNLTFKITSIKDPALPDADIWTNANQANTPQCNDLHGVDLEIYAYNNDNNYPADCTNDNRAKEGVPADDYGHGTRVANIIAAAFNDATNSSLGVIPYIKIMPIKVNIPFTPSMYVDRIAQAIVYAVDNGAKIINISASTPYDVQVLKDAVSYANDHNVIIVASAGNAGIAGQLMYPAAYASEYSNVIAAGSINNNGAISSYSNYKIPYTVFAYVGETGVDTNSIKITAPACVNTSCVPTKNDTTGDYEISYTDFSDVNSIGTSFSAPQISGMIPFLLSRDPNISPKTVKQLLVHGYTYPTLGPATLNLYTSLYKTPGFYTSKTTINNIGHLQIRPHIFIADVNGDGKDDIIQVSTSNIDDTHNIAWWTVNTWNSQINTFNSYHTLIGDFGNVGDSFLVGDVDGDGKADAVVVRQIQDGDIYHLNVYVAKSNGYNFEFNGTWLSGDIDSKASFYLADVNGDGKKDLLMRNYDSTSGNSIFKVGLSTGSNFGTLADMQQVASITTGALDKFYIADTNGDGKDDIIRVNIASDTHQGSIYVSLAGTSLTYQAETSWLSSVGEINAYKTIMFKDINKDNKADIIVTYPSRADKLSWQVGLSTGSSFNSLETKKSDFGDINDLSYVGIDNSDDTGDFILLRINKDLGQYKIKIYKEQYNADGTLGNVEFLKQAHWTGDWIYFADFNADNYTDIIIGRPVSTYQMAWYVSLYDNNTKTFAPLTLIKTKAGGLLNGFYIGDYNGDKKADLFMRVSFSSTKQSWYVFASNGNILLDPSLEKSDFGNIGDTWYIADVNGDGKTDLVLNRPISSTVVNWYVSLANSSGGYNAASRWQYDFGNKGEHFMLGDINQDNKADLILPRIVSSTTVKWYVANSTGTKFTNIHVMSNDFGNKGDTFFISDLDNNGKIDAIALRADTPYKGIFYYKFSDGNTFASTHEVGKAYYFTYGSTIHKIGDNNAIILLDLHNNTILFDKAY